MPTYLALYRVDADAPAFHDITSPGEVDARKKAWGDWLTNAGGAIADFGAPLRGVVVTPERTRVSGFTMVRAETEAEAVALFEDHPHRATGGSIDLLELAGPPNP